MEKQITLPSGNSTIFVGNKPLVNYIRAVMGEFTKKDAKEVRIKSRGKFISRAVDVAEVSRRNLSDKKPIYVKEVSISSESFASKGKNTNISTMDIILSKK